MPSCEVLTSMFLAWLLYSRVCKRVKQKSCSAALPGPPCKKRYDIGCMDVLVVHHY